MRWPSRAPASPGVCEASGSALDWHGALEPSAAIRARASNHIARFLHESTGNALRHAHVELSFPIHA
jgi:hypothetical protein